MCVCAQKQSSFDVSFAVLFAFCFLLFAFCFLLFVRSEIFNLVEKRTSDCGTDVPRLQCA